MKKRAQFFLIAGLLIATLILGLGQVYTQAKTQQQQGLVYQLSDEIYYETSQVIDNGILTDKSSDQINQELTQIIQYYASSNPDSDIVLLYGNSNDVQEISFTGDLENLIIRDLPESSFETDGENMYMTITLPSGEIKEVRRFKVNQGQNFYVVVRKRISNEEYLRVK